jgi:hypothetical protein
MKSFHACFQNINGSDSYPLDQVIYQVLSDSSFLKYTTTAKRYPPEALSMENTFCRAA